MRRSLLVLVAGAIAAGPLTAQAPQPAPQIVAPPGLIARHACPAACLVAPDVILVEPRQLAEREAGRDRMIDTIEGQAREIRRLQSLLLACRV